MFRKILIANRGEIAVRIAQTVQQLDIRAVGVYSDADRGAVHVGCMDEAGHLDGETAAETYLDINKILQVARDHQVDALHPGYGFLSENARFAEACAAAGLTFIGPSPEVIRAMGDKQVARRAAQAAGVAVLPGGAGDLADLGQASAEAAAIGYPVLVKASAGGGGKGMRLVQEPAELQAAVQAAQRESTAAFGDGRVFLEKYLSRPRHVEVQIFGAADGRAVHLFERECSIQRRHQKIIEESPSAAVDSALRQQMGAAAVQLAEAIGYRGAGTVEFLLDPTGRFYFLEVNTRLQVEHPVTELVVGLDLVAAQIAVAAGAALPFDVAELAQRGHALECRVYAEDPRRGFLPSTGTIVRYVPPGGPHIRVDSGVAPGSVIGVHYDPLLAKLIVWGRDRAAALARMRWALARFVIMGVRTNLEFLQAVLADPRFAAGALHTHFLDEFDGAGVGPPSDAALIIAALSARPAGRGATRGSSGSAGPWARGGGWRLCS